MELAKAERRLQMWLETAAVIRRTMNEVVRPSETPRRWYSDAGEIRDVTLSQ